MTQPPHLIDPADYTEWVRGLVRNFTKEFQIHQEEYEELVGIALLGLVEAAERYQADKGVPFKSYARFRVRGALFDGLSQLTGLSRAGHAKARAYRALTDNYELEEIQRIQEGTPEEKLALVFQKAADAALVHRLSLNFENGDEMLGSTEQSQEDALIEKETSEKIRSAVATLSEKERIVIEEYYFQHKTLDEIAMEHGFSKGWISKVHKRALTDLHGRLAPHERKERDEIL